MTISINQTKTMQTLIRELARHQNAGHRLNSSDLMLDLAAHLDFEALDRVIASHLDLVTVTVYLRDMADFGIIPRDLTHVRPVLKAAYEARFQYRDRQNTVSRVS